MVNVGKYASPMDAIWDIQECQYLAYFESYFLAKYDYTIYDPLQTPSYL